MFDKYGSELKVGDNVCFCIMVYSHRFERNVMNIKVGKIESFIDSFGIRIKSGECTILTNKNSVIFMGHEADRISTLEKRVKELEEYVEDLETSSQTWCDQFQGLKDKYEPEFISF